MKYKKVEFTGKELKQLAAKFKVLGETSRLKILQSLTGGELCVNEIIDATGLMQANVSKQLKLMQNQEIVDCRPSGLQRFYRIADPTVVEICETLCKSSGSKR